MVLPQSFSTSTTISETEFIDTGVLLSVGAAYKKVKAGEMIIREDEHAHFYYQVVEGKVKMYNCNDDGKEFIQGFFSAGDSFGEPPLFNGGTYPSNAIAVTDGILIRLNAPVFIDLVLSQPALLMKFTKLIAIRLINKTLSLKNIVGSHPEEKIISLLNRIRDHAGTPANQKIKIDLTRQEIADMVGLRVETVIRMMRILHERKIIEIIRGKVFY